MQIKMYTFVWIEHGDNGHCTTLTTYNQVTANTGSTVVRYNNAKHLFFILNETVSLQLIL